MFCSNFTYIWMKWNKDDGWCQEVHQPESNPLNFLKNIKYNWVWMKGVHMESLLAYLTCIYKLSTNRGLQFNFKWIGYFKACDDHPDSEKCIWKLFVQNILIKKNVFFFPQILLVCSHWVNFLHLNYVSIIKRLLKARMTRKKIICAVLEYHVT